jgi:hypothetical protein
MWNDLSEKCVKQNINSLNNEKYYNLKKKLFIQALYI